MDVAGDKADTRLACLGHRLKALHESRALAAMRFGVPVVYDVVQQLRVPKPDRAAPAVCPAAKIALPCCTGGANSRCTTLEQLQKLLAGLQEDFIP